jgi:hypothetical protein
MAEIVLPIIVVEGHDVDLHFTVGDAENALEPWWVKQHEGAIYDATGHRLSAEVVARKGALPFPLGTGPREKVRIITEPPFVDASEELRLALIGHLQASSEVHDKDSLSSMPLSVLLDRVVGSRKR